MTKFVRAHYKILIVSLVIAAVVGYQLYKFLLLKPAPGLLIAWDLVSYFVALIQHNNPALLPHDTIYGNGQFTNSIWYGSAFLFEGGLSILYTLTNGDPWLTYGLLVIITLAIYLVIAYVFFASVLPDWRLALGLALVSSVVSHFSATSTYWGIPPNDPKITIQLIPQVLYYVFTVFVAWLIVRAVTVAEDGSVRISHWKTAGLGVLIGASIYVVHSISAIAMIEITVLSGMVLVLRRKLSLWTVVIFAAVTIPFVVPRLLSSTGSGAPQAMPLYAAQTVISSGDSWMVFPWLTRFRRTTVLRATLTYDFLVAFLVWGIILYVVLSAAFFILAMRDRRRAKLWKTLFLFTQAGLCLVTFRAGWLPVLVLIYGCIRIWRETEDELDRVLLTVMMVSLLTGQVQQAIFFYVWAVAHLVQVTAILFEMARFEGMAYLPLYILVGRAIWELIEPVGNKWARLGTMALFCFLIYENLASAPIPLGLWTPDAPWQLLLALLAIVLEIGRLNPNVLADVRKRVTGQQIAAAAALLAGLVGTGIVLLGPHPASPFYVTYIGLALALLGWAALAVITISRLGQSRSSLALVIGAELLLAGFVFGVSSDPLNIPQISLPFQSSIVLPTTYPPGSIRNRAPVENATDYLAAAAWAKANTPPDSLFHIVDFNANFRYFSERSILMSYTDPFTLAIYSGSNSASLWRMWVNLETLRTGHAVELTSYLAQQHVDYVLAKRNGLKKVDLAESTDCGQKVVPSEVFRNNTYVIVQLHVDSAPAATTPTTNPGSNVLCPAPVSTPSPGVPMPCGAANISAWGDYEFQLRNYPACKLPAEETIVKCLTGDGTWTGDTVSNQNTTASPGNIQFTVKQVGVCGLFPAH